MASILDYRALKSAGVYTLEIDKTETPIAEVSANRLLVGFTPRAPFNVPVYLNNDTDRAKLWGPINDKTERKGSFFNRSAQTMLEQGPIFALNLLKVDQSINGPDKVNFAALSVDAGAPNYAVRSPQGNRFLQVDTNGYPIQNVGSTNYAALFDRSRFWKPSAENLLSSALMNLTNDSTRPFEYGNIVNVANIGTEDISIIVMKPENLSGYDVTAREWYGSDEAIPYPWIRPTDYMSDYFIHIIAVKGTWTDYNAYAIDPTLGDFFTNTGVRKGALNNFLGHEGVEVVGGWIGSIIPEFKDKTGANEWIEPKVNQSAQLSGLLISINIDALNVISYDFDGVDDITGTHTWVYDIDGDGEGDSINSQYLIDMVGHNLDDDAVSVKFLSYNYESPVDAVGSATGQTMLSAKNIYGLWETGGPVSGLASVTKSNFYTTNSQTASIIKAGYMLNNGTRDSDGEVSPQPAKILTRGFVPYINLYDTVAGEAITYEEIMGTIGDKTWSLTAKVPMGSLLIGDAAFSVTKDSNNNLTVSNAIYDPARQRFGAYLYTTDLDLITALSDSDNLSVTKLSYTTELVNEISGVHYLSELIDDGEVLNPENKNLFIVLNKTQADKLKVGDFVKNLASVDETAVDKFRLIPGLTRIIRKTWVAVNPGDYEFVYENKKFSAFDIKNELVFDPQFRTYGFYLYLALDQVGISQNTIKSRKPITDSVVSASLNFIPLKGLKLTSRHLPGYDESGNISPEYGVIKIYSMLEDEGIKRGLLNPDMIDFRYIVDSMGYGLMPELGGKVYLSKLAKARGKCTALLNAPSMRQFEVSTDPYFCDTFTSGVEIKPAFKTSYIPTGGNIELYASKTFTLPSEQNGAKYMGAFAPYLKYQSNGKTLMVPPAADVSNTFIYKFNGGDPYAITANLNGILSSRFLSGVEYPFDKDDRDALEPMGINPIIQRKNRVMIYGNRTAFQHVRSDFNFLHVRELLNTIEIECEAVLQNYVFDFNNPVTRGNIVTLINPILKAMKDSGALYNYSIVMDRSNNTDEVIQEGIGIIDIGVEITKGMERILQRITVNKIGQLS